MNLLKNKKAMSATAVAILVIIVIAVIGVSVVLYWNLTHYSIGAGQVGVVTDQIGGIVRIQKGPLGWAEKTLWENIRYYDIMVKTEDMISPSETTANGTIIMRPEPLKDLRYGAIRVNTLDVPNVFIDISVQWHIDADRSGWENRVASLYLNYPGQDYETKTVLPAVRDAVRNYAGHFTMEETVYTKIEQFELDLTPYTQEFIGNITTLNNAIIIDRVFVRTKVPPLNVQEVYAKVLLATKEAEARVITAEGIKTATITVAEGQSIAIQLVTNATSESVSRLVAQNVTTDKAIEYLGLQYTFDQLKKIAETNPQWKITLFINTPTVTYTIPISETENP